MNKLLKTWLIPGIAALCGVIGAGLQFWALSTVNPAGLLNRGHFSLALTWILTALVLAATFLFSRLLTQAPKYRFNFPPSFPGALGTVFGAAGIFYATFSILETDTGTLSLITAAVALLAELSLLIHSYARLQGKRINALAHSSVCLWFLFLLICQYRQWSAEPQLQLYAFSLLATVFLMLSTFQRACFDGRMGSRRSYAFFRLSAIYFCLIAIPGSAIWPMYLFCAVWCLTDLCNLTAIPKKGR